jgi:hypothetical protein
MGKTTKPPKQDKVQVAFFLSQIIETKGSSTHHIREVEEAKSPRNYTSISTSPCLAKPAHACVSWAQYQAPALASPAQRLVVGVVVVGRRHCSPATGCTVGSSLAAMASKLLLLPQLLWGYGHLHRLAVPTRPAPPRAARRPGPYHASDPSNALLLHKIHEPTRSETNSIARSCRLTARH